MSCLVGSWRIAADVRELFVDVEAYSPLTKSFYIIRTLNRKDQLFSGLLEAINLLPSEVKSSDTKIWIYSDFERVSLREKWGSPCAFITSEGFEDLLHISDGRRSEVFGLHAERSGPLVSHDQAFGLSERTHADGTIEKKPTADEISTLVAKLGLAEIKNIGLCFLHSPKNPENEKYVADILKQQGFNVFCSFEELGDERERAKRVCEKAFSNLGSTTFRESLEILFSPENIFVKNKRPALLDSVPQNTLHVEFLEDRFICNVISGKESRLYETSLTPLSTIDFEDGGFVHIGEAIDTEPGPVVLGKGIKLSIFDLISYKTKLQVEDSTKIKIDLSRVQKFLAPVAKNLQLDLETCVDKYVSLFQESLALEIEGSVLRRHTPPLLVATGIFAQFLGPSLARSLGVRKIFIPHRSRSFAADLLLEEKLPKIEAQKFGDLIDNVPGRLDEGEVHDL